MMKTGGKHQKEESSYEIRDVVLAKIRGYPPWPGIVSGRVWPNRLGEKTAHTSF
jgi:hypothetical protein